MKQIQSFCNEISQQCWIPSKNTNVGMWRGSLQSRHFAATFCRECGEFLQIHKSTRNNKNVGVKDDVVIRTEHGVLRRFGQVKRIDYLEDLLQIFQ